MQRFFVEPHQIDRDRHEIRITGNDVNHIVNVLRMKKTRSSGSAIRKKNITV